VLKFLQEFVEVVFRGVTMKSLLDANDVWSGQTTDPTRVPAQQVHNSWSDRWIMLKFLQEFAEAVFHKVKKISLLDSPSFLSGQTTDETRITGQKVHNSWSNRWIVLKFLQEFMEAVFHGVTMKSLLVPTVSGRARPPTIPEYRLNRFITLDPTVGSCSNFYRSFRRLFILESQWNRYSMPTTSSRARTPTTEEHGSKGP